MRIEDEIHDFQLGDVFLCPPGQAHQLINNSTEDFEFLVIANNPDFDTCYYPDSDKLLLHPRWGAKPKDYGKSLDLYQRRTGIQLLRLYDFDKERNS